jgi:heat shock protein beta
LVADEMEELVPRYLNFVKGLVDSNDLPLNVNREQFQKNKVMKVISKKLTRKGLDLLRKMAEAEEGSDDDEDEDEEDDDELTAEDDDDEEDEGEKTRTIEKTIWFWKRLNEN